LSRSTFPSMSSMAASAPSSFNLKNRLAATKTDQRGGSLRGAQAHQMSPRELRQ
jgi:hypothetical protein